MSKQLAHEGSNVVSPSTGRLYTPGNITGTHFCLILSRPQGHSQGLRQ